MRGSVSILVSGRRGFLAMKRVLLAAAAIAGVSIDCCAQETEVSVPRAADGGA